MRVDTEGGVSNPTSKANPLQSILGGPNLARVTVNGVLCTALVDTGSQVTTITRAFIDENKDKFVEIHPLEDMLTITGAGGNVLPYEGFVEMDICLTPSGPTLPILALVMSGPAFCDNVPCVVGTNFLRPYLADLQLLSQQNQLTPAWTMALSTMIKSDDTDGLIGHIQTTKAEIIAPNSRKVVKGLMRADPASLSTPSNAMMEPTLDHSLPGGVVVTPTVMEFHNAQVSTYRIQVELQNLSAHKVTIPPKSVLCGLHKVELEEMDPEWFREDDPDFLKKFEWPEDLHQARMLRDVILKWSDVFSKHDLDHGHTDVVRHKINLLDERPIKIPHRRIPPGIYDELKQHLREMLEGGHVRPSQSPWAFPVVLVRKKDKTLRFCVDYRELNKRTIKDAYALPRIEETMDYLMGLSTSLA